MRRRTGLHESGPSSGPKLASAKPVRAWWAVEDVPRHGGTNSEEQTERSGGGVHASGAHPDALSAHPRVDGSMKIFIDTDYSLHSSELVVSVLSSNTMPLTGEILCAG